MRVLKNTVSICLLFTFGFLGTAYAEEPAAPVLPQLTSTASDGVEVQSPDAKAESESRSKEAQLGELEDAEAKEQESAVTARSAPSDGSEDGGAPSRT